MFYYTNHPTLSLKSEPLIAKLQISLSPTIDWTNLEWHYIWGLFVGYSVASLDYGCTNHQATKVWATNQSKELKCCQNWNVTKTEILLVASHGWKKTITKSLMNSSFNPGQTVNHFLPNSRYLQVQSLIEPIWSGTIFGWLFVGYSVASLD